MNGEITVTVTEQVSVLLWAIAAGVAMGLYYDLFRAIRIIFNCTRVSVILQDVFFWITSAVAVFFISITVNFGYLRIYFVMAILLSWLLYFVTLGRVTMFIVNIIAKMLKQLIELCRKYITVPVSRCIDNFFMLIGQKISGLFIHMTKNSKNHKKC